MKSMTELNYQQAHEFVSKNKKNGFYWDGWTIVKWSPGHNGYMQTNGMYRHNKWGYSSSFKLTNKGTWWVPSKYVTNT